MKADGPTKRKYRRFFFYNSGGQCSFTSRHYDRSTSINRSNSQQQRKDPVLAFYKQTLDSLHFYLFHIFDAGLRPSRSDMNDRVNMEISDERLWNSHLDYWKTEPMTAIALQQWAQHKFGESITSIEVLLYLHL